MSLLGGLLDLPGKILGGSLKALTGQSQSEKKSAPPPPPPSLSSIRDNMTMSDEMAESIGAQPTHMPNLAQMNLGSSNDLMSLQAPLAPAYGMNQGRYDYNPQAVRVQKLFESQMTDFGQGL